MKILAVAGGTAAAAPLGLSYGSTPEPFIWRGTALGARASLKLFHVGPTEGKRLLARTVDEIARLEKVFSLYHADSAISRLNSDEYISNPPIDLVRLLSQAVTISDATDGAFDVTVQPLWRLYAGYFGGDGSSTAGPGPEAVRAALGRVGYRHLSIDLGAVRFNKPDMAITLNGIAQGYITDRIADLLRSEGCRHVLIDMGEIRVLEGKPDGSPWTIGLRNPQDPGRVLRSIEVTDKAVATSAGSGTRFDNEGVFHHLFDPRSGRCSDFYNSVSVTGARATVADALSTGLYHLPPEAARAVLARFPGYSVYVVQADGRQKTWAA